MTTGFRVGGVWRDLDQPSIKIAGVWKDCDSIHIRQGGAWKEVWAAAAAEILRLNTTINQATHFYKKKPKEIEFQGFDAGTDPKSFPNFGSIVTGGYTDGNAVSRTVTALYAHSTGQFPSWIDALWLNISSFPPDTDATFSKIVVNGNTFTRAAADATGGARWWRWNSVGVPYGVNPNSFQVWTG